MYICPTCNCPFKDAEAIKEHSLKCWKAHNPNHKSTPAPRGPDVVEREVNDDVLNFFAALQERKNNGNSKT